MTRRALALVLVVVAVGLVILAHVTPVDPTWIAGLYDNADGDDAILAARSMLGETAPALPLVGRPTVAVVSDPVEAPAMVANARPASVIKERAPPFA